MGSGRRAPGTNVLQKLFDRDYVNQRQLEPTTTGIAVTEALRAHAPVITRPEMTHRLEEDMELVAQSKKAKADVLEESREMLREAHALLAANAEGVRETLTGALDRQHFVGPCPKCGGAMLLARSPRGSRWIQCVNNPATCTSDLRATGRGVHRTRTRVPLWNVQGPEAQDHVPWPTPRPLLRQPRVPRASEGVPDRHVPELQEPPRYPLLLPGKAVRRVHRLPDVPGHLPAAPAGKARQRPPAVPGLRCAGGDRDRGRSASLDPLHQSGVPHAGQGGGGPGREEGHEGGRGQGEGSDGSETPNGGEIPVEVPRRDAVPPAPPND